MSRPILYIITGLPGTGKTTFGKYLSNEFHFPFFSKDVIKELIFDSLGYSDREWSKKAGLATYSIIDYLLNEELGAQRSFVLESNFKPEFDNEKFQQLQMKYKYDIIQFLFTANANVLFERFKQRAESGQRHPGHADFANLAEWKEVFATQRSSRLDVQGKVITVDTTDFMNVHYEQIIQNLR